MKFSDGFRTMGVAALALCAALGAHRMHAATYVWTGAGSDSAWSTAANWAGAAVPTPPGSAEDTILFAATTRYRPQQDVGQMRLNRLVFDGSAAGYVLSTSSGGLIFDQRADGTLPAIEQHSTALQTLRSFYRGPNAIQLAADTTITGEGSGGLELQAELVGPGRLIIDLPAEVRFQDESRINTHAGTEIRQGVLSAWADSTLGASGVPLVLDGGTLYLSGPSPGSWTRPIQVGSQGGTLMVAGEKTYSGPISGSGILTVARSPTGDGQLTLAGTNSVAGGTRVEGVLCVDSGDRLGAAGVAVQLAGGVLRPTAALSLARTLLVEQTGTFDSNGLVHTLSAPLAGSGTLTKTGDGWLVLTAPGDLQGRVVVERGVLRIEDDLALQQATVELVETGSLEFSTGQPLLGGLAGPRDLYLPDLDLRVGNNGQSTVFSGDISGAGRLVKLGPGTLRLEGRNTHQQGTTVYQGRLEIDGDEALGAEGVELVLDGGTLRLADSVQSARPVSLGTAGGTIETADDQSTSRLAGPLTGNGALAKTGPGRLILQADNTYSGGTSLVEGTLVADRDAALGQPAGPLTFQGGTLRLDGSFSSARTLAVAAQGGSIDTSQYELQLTGSATVSGPLHHFGPGTLQFSGPVELTGQLANFDGQLILAGPLSGSGEVQQNGTGQLVFAGATTFAGKVFLAVGSARVEDDAALQNAGVQLESGTLLDLSPAEQPVLGTLNGYGQVQLEGTNLLVGNNHQPGDFRGTIEGTGGLTKIGNGLLHLAGDNTYSGPTTIRGGTLSVASDDALGLPDGPIVFEGGTLLVAGPFDSLRPVVAAGTDARIEVNSMATLGGPVSGSAGLVKTGPGTLVLAGSNTYAGTTRIEQGAVQLAAPDALPAGSRVELEPGTTLDLGGLDLEVGELEGMGTIETAGATLTIDCPAAISFAGRIAGSGSLTKNGSGTLTLTAASTYTGPTLVNAGQLVVQAPLASPSLAVSNDAALRLENVVLPVSPLRSLQAESGGSIEYQQSTVPGGYLRGPGVHRVTGSGASRFEAVTAFPSTQIEQQAPLEMVNVLSGAEIRSYAPLRWDGGMNLSSGQLTIHSTLETSDWINDGVVVIASGGVLENHTSRLTSGGGSRIVIEPGGSLHADARGENIPLELQGALLVNNGTITGQTNVYYGATLKGTGTFGSVQLFEGGRFSPGNSVGTARVQGDLIWGPRGRLDVEIVDAAAAPGTGYDLVRLLGPESRLLLAAGADPAEAFTIHLISGLADQPGLVANFDPQRPWRWLLVEGAAEIDWLDSFALDDPAAEPAGAGASSPGFSALDVALGAEQSGWLFAGSELPGAGPPTLGIVLDTADFRNPLAGGRFGLAAEQGNLYLTFEPVPEPGSLELLAVLAGGASLLAGCGLGRGRSAVTGETPDRKATSVNKG